MATSPSPVLNPSVSHSRSRERTAWFVLAILLLFSIAAPINQFKVPPILPVLMKSFKVTVGQAGLLMSVYAITGLVLALPAGLIFQRVGYRLTGLLAGGSIVVGAVWGGLSSDMTGLLVSRVVEGIGTSFMAVLAPAVIAMWFDPAKRGSAMGIWSTWVPIGSTVMLIAAPLLTQVDHWQNAWWFGALYALVVTALALAFVKPTPSFVTPTDGIAASPPALSATQVLRHREVWLLSLAFGCFTMAFMASATFLPTFLNLVRGLSLPQAGLVASISSMVAIGSGPVGGILSDRIGSRKRPYLAGLLFTALLAPLMVVASPSAIVVLVIAVGLFAGLVPTNIFSAALETVGDERLGGMAMGIIMVGQNAGMLAGPIVFGALLESAGGWLLAFGSLAVMCLLGAWAGGMVKVR